jgi:hypothetical protein
MNDDEIIIVQHETQGFAIFAWGRTLYHGEGLYPKKIIESLLSVCACTQYVITHEVIEDSAKDLDLSDIRTFEELSEYNVKFKTKVQND